jgi:predicted NBD/HSP70 family sugar kinase
VIPSLLPPLDKDFCPAVLSDRAFVSEAKTAGAVPLVFGLERPDSSLSRFETVAFPAEHPYSKANLRYAERVFKFLLWQRGGFRAYVEGPKGIAEHLQMLYSATGKRCFDARFMGEEVYERPFEVLSCPPGSVPKAREVGRAQGRNLEGCRIGFDLGASDRKVSAVMDGQVVFSEEVVWEPRRFTDPKQHYDEVMASLRSAAKHLPRVDAIGGSAAGIYLDNQVRVASLFRGVPKECLHEIRTLFVRMGQEWGVPFDVINDGDVTALAGSMSLEDSGVLGLALGSSEAAGYVNPQGHLQGWLNELAFAPMDYNPSAPIDEWSGDRGVGAQYLSQQAVFRLAPKAGIAIPEGLKDAERLAFVQDKLEAGHEGANLIWQSMGTYAGYAIAHYATFYDLKHVLVLGRCTTGRGGELILQGAQEVLRKEFPEYCNVHIQLPDEKSRRIGQSVAAASLPIARSSL